MTVRRANLLTIHAKRKYTQRLLCTTPFLSAILFFALLPTSSAALIRSRSAIVVEGLTGKVLYAKDPQYPLPPASTAKLMTAIIALDRLNPSDVLIMSKNATRAPRPKVFKAGEGVSVEQLLYAALMKSANDAAVALADAVAGSEKEFVNLMNEKAILIGTDNTIFANSTGLPGPGQYTTVSDLSTIMKYALGYPKLRQIMGTPVAQLSTTRRERILLKNTDKLLWLDKDLIGGKTGYTVDAGHCFVCAAERGDRKIIVVLLNAPTRKLLWKEAAELLDKGFNPRGDTHLGE